MLAAAPPACRQDTVRAAHRAITLLAAPTQCSHAGWCSITWSGPVVLASSALCPAGPAPAACCCRGRRRFDQAYARHARLLCSCSWVVCRASLSASPSFLQCLPVQPAECLLLAAGQHLADRGIRAHAAHAGGRWARAPPCAPGAWQPRRLCAAWHAACQLSGAPLLAGWLPAVPLPPCRHGRTHVRARALGDSPPSGCCCAPQGKSVQQPVWRFQLPGWMQVEDEQGEAVTHGDLAPTGARQRTARSGSCRWTIARLGQDPVGGSAHGLVKAVFGRPAC